MSWKCEIIDGYKKQWIRFTQGSTKKDIWEQDFKDMMEAYIKMKGEQK